MRWQLRGAIDKTVTVVLRGTRHRLRLFLMLELRLGPNVFEELHVDRHSGPQPFRDF